MTDDLLESEEYGTALMQFYRCWNELVALQRADARTKAAEEMRERAAMTADDIAYQMTRDPAATVWDISKAIRALPIEDFRPLESEGYSLTDKEK